MELKKSFSSSFPKTQSPSSDYTSTISTTTTPIKEVIQPTIPPKQQSSQPSSSTISLPSTTTSTPTKEVIQPTAPPKKQSPVPQKTPPIKSSQPTKQQNTNVPIYLTYKSFWNTDYKDFDVKAVTNTTLKYYPNVTNEEPNPFLYLRSYRNHKRVPASQKNIKDYFTRKVYLFVVNFHFIFYDNISFMDESYFPTFASIFKYDFDVIYIGPQSNSQYRVLSNNLPIRGYYSYHTLRVALELLPRQYGFNYAGFFLMNDDSCIHPGFLNNYNLTSSMGEHKNRWTSKDVWMWNTMKNMRHMLFAKAYIKALWEIQKIPYLQNQYHISDETFFRGYSDFFYISQKDIPSFCELESILFYYGVFLENAVPSILKSVNGTEIINCNHGYMPHILTCVHLHPVKFSSQVGKDICMNRMKSINLRRKPKVAYFIVCFIPPYFTAREFH